MATWVGLAVLATGTAGCLQTQPSATDQHGTTVRTTPTPSPSPLATPSTRSSHRPVTTAARRPNIITIVTDDMRTDDLRFMPNVRHLIGARGLDFRNSFSPDPLCAPARSSLLTGNYPHNTRVLSVDPPHDFEAFDDRHTVATSLQRAGYRTLFLGKYMNGYGDGSSAVTHRTSFHYVPPGWTSWWGAVNRPTDSGFASGGTYDYYNLLLNHDGHIDDSHQGDYQTNVEGRIARRLVTRYARSPEPFYLYFAPIAPHFGSPTESDDPLPVVRPDTGRLEQFKTPARPLSVRGRFDDLITRPSGLFLDGGSQDDVSGLPAPLRRLPPIMPDEERAMLDVTRQRAEALVVLDRQIGKLVSTLKSIGAYDDTVVMFTSDNGYFLGEHRLRQGKIWTHEPALRVPFLIAGPGIAHGRRYDPISSPDIAATVMDLAGADPAAPVDGVSVVPSLTHDRGWTRPVVVENKLAASAMRPGTDDPLTGADRGMTGSGIRTARWEYVRYVDGDTELYDLDHDPNELHDLAGLPRYTTVQRQLHTVWEQRRTCSGAACSAPLPTGLAVGPTRLAAATRQQERGVEALFGVPAP